MNKSIICLILLFCSGSTTAAGPADLTPDAPDRYVVVRGDTLWAISKRFLSDPWRWPELWKANQDQIRDPHWIYPGDVLVLEQSGAEVRLKRLSRQTVSASPEIRVQQIPAQAIPPIAIADIGPFLSKPLVITPDQFANAPRIVRTQESRVALGVGNIAYAQGVTKEQGGYWQIFRPGSPLVDPMTNESLGNVAVYLGEAKVNRYGDVSTLEIVSSPQEIYAGDYLQASPREITFDGYAPHAPAKKVDARIIALYGALYETGPNAIITINKGTRDGVEPGHVMAIYRNLNAPTFTLRESPLYGRTGLIYNEDNPRTHYYNEPLGDRNSPLYGRTGPLGMLFADDKTNLPNVMLPDERYGLLMVFRVFERASYALVMNASRPVNVLDIATNP